MTDSLVARKRESGWAHSTSHRETSVSSPSLAERAKTACFLVVSRSGAERAFATYERALAARRRPTDAVVEIIEGDAL